MTISHESVERTISRLGKVAPAVNSATEAVLANLGEYVASEIRSGKMSSWIDNTGNLRSSVGYVLCKQGRIISMSNFTRILNGEEGARKGEEMANRIAREHVDSRYVLAIMAGEEYSVYVEAMESKTVISGAQLYIEGSLPKMLRNRFNALLRGL